MEKGNKSTPTNEVPLTEEQARAKLVEMGLLEDNNDAGQGEQDKNQSERLGGLKQTVGEVACEGAAQVSKEANAGINKDSVGAEEYRRAAANKMEQRVANEGRIARILNEVDTLVYENSLNTYPDRGQMSKSGVLYATLNPLSEYSGWRNLYARAVFEGRVNTAYALANYLETGYPVVGDLKPEIVDRAIKRTNGNPDLLLESYITENKVYEEKQKAAKNGEPMSESDEARLRSEVVAGEAQTIEGSQALIAKTLKDIEDAREQVYAKMGADPADWGPNSRAAAELLDGQALSDLRSAAQVYDQVVDNYAKLDKAQQETATEEETPEPKTEVKQSAPKPERKPQATPDVHKTNEHKDAPQTAATGPDKVARPVPRPVEPNVQTATRPEAPKPVVQPDSVAPKAAEAKIDKKTKSKETPATTSRKETKKEVKPEAKPEAKKKTPKEQQEQREQAKSGARKPVWILGKDGAFYETREDPAEAKRKAERKERERQKQLEKKVDAYLTDLKTNHLLQYQQLSKKAEALAARDRGLTGENRKPDKSKIEALHGDDYQKYLARVESNLYKLARDKVEQRDAKQVSKELDVQRGQTEDSPASTEAKRSRPNPAGDLDRAMAAAGVKGDHRNFNNLPDDQKVAVLNELKRLQSAKAEKAKPTKAIDFQQPRVFNMGSTPEHQTPLIADQPGQGDPGLQKLVQKTEGQTAATPEQAKRGPDMMTAISIDRSHDIDRMAYFEARRRLNDAMDFHDEDYKRDKNGNIKLDKNGNKEVKLGARARNVFNRLWKGNVFRGYYETRYTREARADIEAAERISWGGGEAKTPTERARLDLIKRMCQDSDEYIATSAGESRQLLSHDRPEYKDMVKAISEFATGKMNDGAFQDEVNRINAALHGEGSVTLDNYAAVAKYVKTQVDHGVALEQVMQGFKMYDAESRTGARTKQVETVFEKMGRAGEIMHCIPPEVVAGAASAATFVATSFARNKAVQLGTLGAGSIFTGVLAAGREAKTLNSERAVLAQQLAEGGANVDGKINRKLGEVMYNTISAKDLTDKLRQATESGDTRLMVNTLQQSMILQAISDRRGIDLISYTSPDQIDSQRMDLTTAQLTLEAKLIAGGNKNISQMRGFVESLAEAIDKTETDEQRQALLRSHHLSSEAQEAFNSVYANINAQDEAYRKLRRRRAAAAGARATAYSMVSGVAMQELVAAFNPNLHGMSDELLGHHDNPGAQHTLMQEFFGAKTAHAAEINPDDITSPQHYSADQLSQDDINDLKARGFTVNENTVQVDGDPTPTQVSAEQATAGNPEFHRLGWYDNGTSVSDGNELTTYNNGSSITFEPTTVSSNGAGVLTADQIIQMGQNGQIKLMISPTAATQTHPFEITGHVSGGQIVFDAQPGSAVADMLNSHSYAYAEVVDGNNMVIGTDVGSGTANTLTDMVANKVPHVESYDVIPPAGGTEVAGTGAGAETSSRLAQIASLPLFGNPQRLRNTVRTEPAPVANNVSGASNSNVAQAPAGNTQGSASGEASTVVMPAESAGSEVQPAAQLEQQSQEPAAPSQPAQPEQNQTERREIEPAPVVTGDRVVDETLLSRDPARVATAMARSSASNLQGMALSSGFLPDAEYNSLVLRNDVNPAIKTEALTEAGDKMTAETLEQLVDSADEDVRAAADKLFQDRFPEQYKNHSKRINLDQAAAESDGQNAQPSQSQPETQPSAAEAQPAQPKPEEQTSTEAAKVEPKPATPEQPAGTRTGDRPSPAALRREAQQSLDVNGKIMSGVELYVYPTIDSDDDQVNAERADYINRQVISDLDESRGNIRTVDYVRQLDKAYGTRVSDLFDIDGNGVATLSDLGRNFIDNVYARDGKHMSESRGRFEGENAPTPTEPPAKTRLSDVLHYYEIRRDELSEALGKQLDDWAINQRWSHDDRDRIMGRAKDLFNVDDGINKTLKGNNGERVFSMYLRDHNKLQADIKDFLEWYNENADSITDRMQQADKLRDAMDKVDNYIRTGEIPNTQ